MTELSEAEKEALALWNAVITALDKYRQDQRGLGLDAFDRGDLERGKAHFRAMHRAAETLAMFVNPFDD